MGSISTKEIQDRITVYLKCAITLSASLQSRGLGFTLLTNRKDLFEQLNQAYDHVLQVREIPFMTKVPPRIPFYSAHFKLDVFRYLSTLSERYVALCDLDMVCINDVPQCLANNANSSIPMCYDISDQVISVYGHDAVIRSLQSVHTLESEGRWSGGEFISGTPQFFLALTKEIECIYDNYINDLKNQYHIGDEAYTSAALEVIRRKGTYIADAGTLKIVGRFWSGRKYPMMPFGHFKQCFLLHLPCDKLFLANISAANTLESYQFINKYNKYRLSLRRLFRRVKNYVIIRLMPDALTPPM